LDAVTVFVVIGPRMSDIPVISAYGIELREQGGRNMCSNAHFRIHKVTYCNTLQTRSRFYIGVSDNK